MKKILVLLFLTISISSYSQLSYIGVGASVNDHSGDPLRTAFIKINQAIQALNDRGITSDQTTAAERNILHNLDPNLVYIGDIAVMKTDTLTIIPVIHAAAGDTSLYPVPGKVGNLYINTSSGDVYVSVKAIRHDGWKKVN